MKFCADHKTSGVGMKLKIAEDLRYSVCSLLPPSLTITEPFLGDHL